MDRPILILFAGSLAAFAFLGYTLRHLAKLGIGITHPRVPVEAGLGVLFLAAGLVLWMYSLS